MNSRATNGVPASCRPPNGTAIGSFHRLESHGITKEWEWRGDDVWAVPGNRFTQDVTTLNVAGWRYVGPIAGVQAGSSDEALTRNNAVGNDRANPQGEQQ